MKNSEAPEKIWVDPEKEGAIWPCHNGIEYIRADVVKEMLDDMQAECESAIERMEMDNER